jgi:putative tryptophan/tyrosine transport system substrate-binding protein
MRRREFIAGLGGAAAWPLAARAQQPPMPVIGYLSAGNAEEDRVVASPPFVVGLREYGYVEGQNVLIERRYAAGHYERLRELADDLVQRRVAVIIALPNTNVSRAATAATATLRSTRCESMSRSAGW